MRKTVNIRMLIEDTNQVLCSSVDSFKEGREALGMALERILMDAGVYKGFGYLDASMLKGDAMSVGVRMVDGKHNFENIDHTRVVYYIDGRL